MLSLTRLLLLVSACTATAAVAADDYAKVLQLSRAGRHEQALAQADQVLAARPKDVQMRFLKGGVLGNAGRIGEAIALYEALHEDHPELAEPLNNAAALYAAQRRFDLARDALERAVRVNPGYSVAHENLGDLYVALASDAYRKALLADTKSQSALPKLELAQRIVTLAPMDAKASPVVAPSTPAKVAQ